MSLPALLKDPEQAENVLGAANRGQPTDGIAWGTVSA